MSNRTCWACASELQESQVFCTNCKSWQNYRRYINHTSLTVSLVAALASVTTIFFDQVKEVYEYFFPRFSVSATGYIEKALSTQNEFYSIILIAKNQSAEDIFFPARMTCSIEFIGHPISYNSHHASVPEVTILQPGETAKLKYSAADNFNYNWPSDGLNHLTCVAEYETISFGRALFTIKSTVSQFQETIPISFDATLIEAS